MHITADINDGFAPKGDQLSDKVLITTLARGVDDQCSFISRKIGDDGENVGSISSTESAFAFWNLVQPGVMSRKLDRVSRKFDACYSLEIGREHDGE